MSLKWTPSSLLSSSNIFSHSITRSVSLDCFSLSSPHLLIQKSTYPTRFRSQTYYQRWICWYGGSDWMWRSKARLQTNSWRYTTAFGVLSLCQGCQSWSFAIPDGGMTALYGTLPAQYLDAPMLYRSKKACLRKLLVSLTLEHQSGSRRRPSARALGWLVMFAAAHDTKPNLGQKWVLLWFDMQMRIRDQVLPSCNLQHQFTKTSWIESGIVSSGYWNGQATASDHVSDWARCRNNDSHWVSEGDGKCLREMLLPDTKIERRRVLVLHGA